MQAFSHGLFAPESALLVVIDIQERLLPAMSEQEQLIHKSCTLIKGARALEIPIIITEQYPKGLGKTDERILSALDFGNPQSTSGSLGIDSARQIPTSQLEVGCRFSRKSALVSLAMKTSPKRLRSTTQPRL